MNALKGMSLAAAVLALCASCATLNPERRYLGKWSGTHEGETITIQFEKNNNCVITVEDEVLTGNWTVEDEGITLTADDETLDGFITSEGELVMSAEGMSIPFKKVK